MPVISFASSKGGAGKTTSAIILATTLARKYKVNLIDTDPAHRLASWASKAKLPENMEIHVSLGEKYIHDEIESAKRRSDFVVLDLEGAATRLNAYAMGESDLVIVPMGDEQPDAEGAIETLAQLALEARNMRREIPVRILFCRTQVAVKSRLEKSLNAQVRDKIGSFTTELHRRTAFSSLHSLGGTLYDMKPEDATGIDKAISNAEQFTMELLSVMDWIKTMRKAPAKAPFQDFEVNHVR